MYWQTRTHCCGHIVAHNVSWAAQTWETFVADTKCLGTGKRGHIVADTLLPTQMFPRLPARATSVADANFVSDFVQKHFVSATNVSQFARARKRCEQQCFRNNVSSFATAFSEQNQKHFLCPGHKICVCNKCCARGQTGKHLCRQHSVRNNVSSLAWALRTDRDPWK